MTWAPGNATIERLLDTGALQQVAADLNAAAGSSTHGLAGATRTAPPSDLQTSFMARPRAGR